MTETTKEYKKKIGDTLEGAITAAGISEVTIREGKAVEAREPVKVNIRGTIDAPARWLEMRHDCVNQKTCHVLVDREAMAITLQCHEHDYLPTRAYGDIIRRSSSMTALRI